MGLKFFDFFAGIGGFRLGMEQAGHECVGHCEIDKYANMSYNAMHKPKESEVYFDDIRTVRAEDMPETDVYCFGFPCQSFSIAGKRRGFNDIRGTLFFEVMRLAAVRKPKILFAENVAGLLSHDRGRTFAVIINTMAELGYFVEWQIINSKYYVPQNRKRVFIIGRFRGSCGGQIFPIIAGRGKVDRRQGHGDIKTEYIKTKVTARKYDIDKKGFTTLLKQAKKNKNLTIAQISEKIKIPKTQVEHYFRGDSGFAAPTPNIWEKLKKVLDIRTAKYDKAIATFETRESVYDMSNRAYRSDGIAPTLLNHGCGPLVTENKLKEITKGKPQGQRVYDAYGLSVTLGSQGGGQGAKTGLYAVKPCLTPNRENKRQNGRRFKEDGEERFALNTQDRHGVLLDNGEEIRIRKLTPKECFRLQGFPDEYFERAAAVCSENQLYKQAGNSVTVNVIYEIAKRLKVQT